MEPQKTADIALHPLRVSKLTVPRKNDRVDDQKNNRLDDQK